MTAKQEYIKLLFDYACWNCEAVMEDKKHCKNKIYCKKAIKDYLKNKVIE
jgi:hypothetical protein